MSKDSFVESTDILKRTVPLMIKHKVPTTPTNYALWYTYTTQQHPQLNLALDLGIEALGHCPPSLCESLYQEHLASKTDRDMVQLRQSLTAMMQELSHTMSDTLSSTESFQGVLDATFNQLERAERDGLSLEDTMKLVRTLLEESRQIQASTGSFQGQLSQAQEEISTLRHALAKSQKEANEDGLTGLFNRRAFDRDLLSYTQAKHPYSLILLDIDKFKDFNDAYGHLLGDQVLKMVAHRIRERCEGQAQCYRFGGEEFAIIYPNSSHEAARQLAESLRRMIEIISVLDKKTGKRISSVTASFGLATRNAAEPYLAVVERADSFLNKAKQLGRNRVLPLN
ncbi:GGDEF domain-containing protein [Photobacterium sp. TY1-4]|uniref:GGDEF domain-containing protein n=1 Tax=Photobacterium sp. TY1-4 TaxID=2899122 RepID=UPI0021C1CF8C|nr:GGDEF domain-containing protein [Photobacterium sp. TY1-4]UXI02099.1 GGDEF domain-containing protein [Photobacterium sp. TY1-4]